MEDYLLTNTAARIDERLPHVKQRMIAQYGRPISDEALLAMLQVEEAYIANAWRAIDERSGSVEAYLAHVLGVDDAGATRIRERLLR
jgi:protein tyrosine/serine phosphatase